MHVEFPLGDQGRTITVRRPSDHQFFALTLIRRPTSTSTAKDRSTFMTRVLTLVESLIDPDDWAQIETDMLRAELSPEDLLRLVGDVLNFAWHADRSNEADPDGEPDGPRPVRPAPRVVSGG